MNVPRTPTLSDRFHAFAVYSASTAGSPWMFIISVTAILVWLGIGPLCQFNETWHLFMNSTTTVITLLLGFLILHTQSREARAMHLKLDNIIAALGGANNRLIGVEEISEDELRKWRKYMQAQSVAGGHEQ